MTYSPWVGSRNSGFAGQDANSYNVGNTNDYLHVVKFDGTSEPGSQLDLNHMKMDLLDADHRVTAIYAWLFKDSAAATLANIKFFSDTVADVAGGVNDVYVPIAANLETTQVITVLNENSPLALYKVDVTSLNIVIPSGQRPAVTIGNTANMRVGQDTVSGTWPPLGAKSSNSSDEWVTQTGSLSQSLSIWADMILDTGGTITIDDPEIDQIHQRDNITDSFTKTFSGTHNAGDVPTSVEIQILEANSEIVVMDWTLVDASPGASTWSGSIEIPSHNCMLMVQARYSNQTGVVARSYNQFGVGDLIALWGQSNQLHLYEINTADGASNGNIRFYAGSNVNAHQAANAVWFDPLYGIPSAGWSPNRGAGAIEYANAYASGQGVVCGFVLSAIAGTPLDPADSGGVGKGSWGVGAAVGDVYDDAIIDVTAVGGSLAGISWNQGERDAEQLRTAPEYQGDFSDFVTEVRGTITNQSSKANLPFFVSQLGLDTVSSAQDIAVDGIRVAQQNAIDGIVDVYFGAATADLFRSDTRHIDETAMPEFGIRWGVATNFVLGVGSYAHGLRFQGIQKTDVDTVTITLLPGGGTDITPVATQLTGWRFVDDGLNLLTVTSILRTGTNTIEAVMSAPVAGEIGAQYLWGGGFWLPATGDELNDLVAERVLDNTAETLPLEPFPISASFDYSFTFSGVNMITTPYSLDIAPGQSAEGAVADTVSTIVAGNMKIFLGSGVDPAKRQSIRGSLRVIYNFMMNNAGKGEVTTGDIVVFGDYLNVNQDTITLTNVTAGIGVNDVAIVVSETFGSATNQTIEYREGFRKLTAQLLTRSAAN